MSEYKSTVVELGTPKPNVPSAVYPSLLIKGIEYTWEVNYLKNLQSQGGTSLPVYIEFNNALFNINSLELTSSVLSVLYSVSNGSYEIFLMKDENTKVKIDYSKGEVLEKVIRLG